METVKGNFGECRFIDCMDADHGLPSIKEKFDLCLTDPPYNINACRNDQKKQYEKKFHKGNIDSGIKYNDNIVDYENWIKEKWIEIKRVSNTQLITIGSPNQYLWFNIENPVDIIYHYKKNGNGITSLSWHNRIEPIFCYGKFNYTHKPFESNVLEISLNNGFLRLKINHSHPKSIVLWKEIILSIKPKSVIDPFLGSGTTSEICEWFGIKWLGFETNKLEYNDIKYRIDEGMKQYKNNQIKRLSKYDTKNNG